MRTIMDVAGDIVLAKVREVLLRIIVPDISIDNVNEIDEVGIKCLKEYHGIEGFILDVDETIRSNGRDIPLANQEWIDRIKDEFKIIVVSNGMDGRLKKYFEERGITYIPFAFKPLKMNFMKACEDVFTTPGMSAIAPEKILVVGDSLVDDIIGAKMSGCKSALIKGVEEEMSR